MNSTFSFDKVEDDDKSTYNKKIHAVSMQLSTVIDVALIILIFINTSDLLQKHDSASYAHLLHFEEDTDNFTKR